MMFHDPQFWVLVAFILFAGIATRPLWNQTKKILDSRIHEIETNFKDLERNLKHITTAFQSEKKRAQSIQKEIETLLADAQQEALRLKESLESQLNQDLKDLERVTLRRFEEKKERALNQAKEQAIQISKDTALQVLKDALSPAVQERLINNQIKYLASQAPMVDPRSKK